MTEARNIGIKKIVSGIALLTNQEARLLTLVAGLLLLGLAVRFTHLRSEYSHPIPPEQRPIERTVP